MINCIKQKNARGRVNRVTMLLLLSFLLSGINAQKHVSVAVFGAIPEDDKNDAAALREAMAYCKHHPGTILQFAPGVYDFRDEKGVQLMNGILEGKIKGNPQDSIFRPYYPYSKGLDFDGLKNITVEASGATLLFDGWGEPVSINHCENIHIKGLTIDYKVKPHLEGVIASVGSAWFDVDVEKLYKVTNKMPLCRIAYYDNKAHRLISREDYFPRFEIISPQKLRIYCKVDSSMVGTRIMASHTFHFRPAILLLDARNTVLQDVTIHSQPGMGVVGHHSENITMDGLRIIPLSGQRMSTNTDATHFTSCKGYIYYYHCQIEGQGDDAVNIHNYYHTIQKPQQGKGYNLILKGADCHAQVLDFHNPGDTMELVDRSTLSVKGRYVVKSCEKNIAQFYTHATFNKDLPENIDNYYLINSSRLPSVKIVGCTVMTNRARGFLIKTRNVLIENNLILESTGTGVHVGAEGRWHEGPASENITIRNNRIVRCGTGSGTVDRTCGIAISVDNEGGRIVRLHNNILIERNDIEGENSENGISVSGANNVVVRYNKISGCKTTVDVKSSNNVRVYANTDIRDFTVNMEHANVGN